MTQQVQPFLRKWVLKHHRRKSLWDRLSAPQLFVGSFALLVALGTLALKLIPGLYAGEPLGTLDALFTATSAVCVTGLVVEDTATFFTPRGQLVVLALIQLGGLGIISFTSLIIVALGRRMSLRHEALAGGAGGGGVAPHVRRAGLVPAVIRFTLALEGAGAVVLFLLWWPSMGWRGAAWHAAFHSVSAFCNAGFSTFSDSLIGFQRAPLTQLVIMFLVVVGGIGFLTLEELSLRRRAMKLEQNFRLSIHTRLVLASTALLVVVGWVLYAGFEWRHTLAGLPPWARVLNGLFMSVTARTAGFNTVDYGRTAASTSFLTVLLMSVGGSPGSMAGGLKTTTVALIGLLAWSRLRGRLATGAWGRTVPEETVQRAVGLFVIAFCVVVVSVFVLTATELHGARRDDFVAYMFEAVSAFSTVGLSMGVTAELSTAGKWTTVLLMFFGRVGPLTLAAALAKQRKHVADELRYAHEDVVVG